MDVVATFMALRVNRENDLNSLMHYTIIEGSTRLKCHLKLITGHGVSSSCVLDSLRGKPINKEFRTSHRSSPSTFDLYKFQNKQNN